MHVRWIGSFRRAEAVEVDLTIITPPSSRHLHFWALQATFAQGTHNLGAGHLGLQWIDGHPGQTAVNWGGYETGGHILDGTDSLLPSALGNPHTRDYSWSAGTTYRLRIDRGTSGWRGSVTDLATGAVTVVRELLAGGDQLSGFVMWSEVFAPCEGPSTTVAWSRPVVFSSDEATPATQFELSYQSFEDGGCTNTNTSIETIGQGSAIVQRTAIPRVNPPGSALTIHP